MFQALTVATLTTTLFYAPIGEAQTVWYVNDDGDSGNGCTSWAEACPELQTALSLAVDGDQIWVSTGTYKPDAGSGDRFATFQLVSGVALFGGFDGTENTLEERAGLFDQTILTGDLNGDDEPDFQNIEDNSLHVVTASDPDCEYLVDGFSIVAGNADGSNVSASGGGVLVEAGNFTLRDCFIEDNFAEGEGLDYGGGGIHVAAGHLTMDACAVRSNWCPFGAGLLVKGQGSAVIWNTEFVGHLGVAISNYDSPMVIDACEFVSNSGGQGGAIRNFGGDLHIASSHFLENSANDRAGAIDSTLGSLTVLDSHFEACTSDNDGGAVYIHGSVSEFNGCVFDSNSVLNLFKRGGAVYNQYGQATFAGCTFISNFSDREGGAIYNGTAGVLTVEQSNFIQNMADFRGSAIFSGSSSSNQPAHTIIDECDFANHEGVAVWLQSGTNVITRCVFQDNYSTPLLIKAFADIKACVFEYNTAINGGGLNVDGGGGSSISDSLFVGNVAESGGAIRNTALLEVNNCLIYGNTAALAGGDLWSWEFYPYDREQLDPVEQ